MNEALITNWNNVVKPNDTVFHLGDFAFGGSYIWNNVLSRLNGNIHLILGNHKNIFCALEEKSSKDTSLIAGTPEMVISIQADKISEGSSTIPEMGVKASALKCEAPNSKAEGEDIVSSVAK